MSSNYMPGSDGPDAPWNRPEPKDDECCTFCGNPFEMEYDEEGRYPIVPIEVTAGRFCSEACKIKDREAEWNLHGQKERIERIREALLVIQQDMPHVIDTADEYDPEVFNSDTGDKIDIHELSNVAGHFLEVLGCE